MKSTGSIPLKDPDALLLEDAYRTLPTTGEVSIDCELQSLEAILEGLESTGFAGIYIRLSGKSQDRIHIWACKGKQGSCYNTGRSARYHGAALAVLDDDHHLLLAGEEMPVCEKTATLYSLPAYRTLISCTDADMALLQKLQVEPETFDCDTFESSLERLYMLTREKEASEEYTELFYPGPFKALVLKDGSVIRRGQVNKVPVSLAKKATESDGLFRLERLKSRPHESFPDCYRSEGSLCLLNRPRDTPLSESTQAPDFNSLQLISSVLRKRLLDILENHKDYFILTGSNREDQFGCCPSDEVTMADSLVRAGILCSTRESTSEDACPLTIYALRDEMSMEGGKLQFTQDETFRLEVLERLIKFHRGWPKKILTWILLIFVAGSIILALTRFIGPSGNSGRHGLYEQLDVSRPDGIAVVLFHYQRRCEQCLSLERFTGEVLKENYTGMVAAKQLQFKEVIMDDPENRNLVEGLDLVTSTVVLIRFEGMEEDTTLVLARSWELYDKETEFKQMLINQLDNILEERK
jgi:hypothetical protein